MDLGEKIRKGVTPKPVEMPAITPTKAPEPETVTVPVRRNE